MKDIMSINILGQPYKLIFETEQENIKLLGHDGYCDWTSRTIVIDKEILTTRSKDSLDDVSQFCKKVIRHEIIHAFLIESGLERYSSNELFVDWIARQWEKIDAVFDMIFIEEDE